MSAGSRIGLAVAAGLWLGILVMAGCSSQAPVTNDDPTTRAEADPMGFGPDFQDQTVSGSGGMNSFDSKAFKRDLDHVLNP